MAIAPILPRLLTSAGLVWLLLSAATLHDRISQLLKVVTLNVAVKWIQWDLYALNAICALVFIVLGWGLSRRFRV